MTALAPLMSSARMDWNTPPEVLGLVRAVGRIRLDPCSNAASVVDAFMEWDGAPNDGLTSAWPLPSPLGGLVYCNPPYGRTLPLWLAKMHAEAERGVEIIALIPARPDTRAWHEHVAPPASAAVCFWRGRIRFVGAPASAPFPSAVVYYGPRVRRFIEVFGPRGAMWRA